MKTETRTGVSKHQATTAADDIKSVLDSYTVTNFVLSKEDIAQLHRMEAKLRAIPCETA